LINAFHENQGSITQKSRAHPISSQMNHNHSAKEHKNSKYFQNSAINTVEYSAQLNMVDFINKSIPRPCTGHEETMLDRSEITNPSTQTDYQNYNETSVKQEYFRSLLPRDREIVQKLHESWFPVRYNKDFYDSLVRSLSPSNSDLNPPSYFSNHQLELKKMDLTRRYRSKEFRSGLHSSVVVEAEMIVYFPNERNEAGPYLNYEEKEAREYNDEKSRISDPLLYHPELQHEYNKNGKIRQQFWKNDTTYGYSDDSYDLEKGSKAMSQEKIAVKNKDFSEMPLSQAVFTSPLSLCTALHENISSLPPPILKEETILGCLIGTFIPISKISANTLSLLISDLDQHPFLFYIMTLGTITEKRHQGYGSKLIQQCIQMLELEENKQCGCIYLHVITYNKGAIRFYESLGFQRITEIEGEHAGFFFGANNTVHNILIAFFFDWSRLLYYR